MKILPFLAQMNPGPGDVTPEDLRRNVGGATSLHSSDILIIIAAALIVLVVLVCWALFIRKPSGNDHSRTRVYKSRPTEEETEDGMIRKRKKSKRPRREHRSRNPTLSEAGGLPPIRPTGSQPPI